MQTFTVWLLLLVTNRTDEVDIVQAYQTQQDCQHILIAEQHNLPHNREVFKTRHYECVEGTVERDTQHPWKDSP